MKVKAWLITSILLNVVLLGICTTAAVIYRDKLFQKLVQMKGQPAIVMYGNSITAQGKWVELLGRTDVLNSGLPGQTTYNFLQSVQSMVIDRHPRICFVKGGINDITVGVEQSIVQQHYRELLEALLKNSIVPVVTLTVFEQNDPASKAKVEKLNTFLVEYCLGHGISYIDLNKYISDSTGLKSDFAVDKTHLNAKAYEIWAREIKLVLAREGI